MEQTKKRTPSDATDFEREQLRFFLNQADITETLASLNPSLAWLPEFAKMKVIQASIQFTPWIEKNFNDYDAIREVSANLEFFDEKAAELLEFRLNLQRGALSPLHVKCWQSIIRHIQIWHRGLLGSEWYDVKERVKAGECSSELFERFASVLRPKPKLGKRISWNDEGDSEPNAQRPSDIMSIEFEIEYGVTEAEVGDAWPNLTSNEFDRRLLVALTEALDAALADALEMEVESNTGYGISDTDVPSVAIHSQNEYRTGFRPIIRAIADIWSRLVRQDVDLGLEFLSRWNSSQLKLNRRLALFAATEKMVPSETSADVLLALPQGLLFLTSSSVEVYRLIKERWGDFSKSKRNCIEVRLAEGPPTDWFRSEADQHIQRSKFRILGNMEQAGLELSDRTKALLVKIRKENPDWELPPTEQAGFHIWSSGVREVAGDSKQLKSISVELLIDVAKQRADSSDFLAGDDWQALCQDYPEHALGGLKSSSQKGDWPDWAWNSFLWATQKLDDPKSVALAGKILLACPPASFSKISSAASWWLNEKCKALDEGVLWPLWDKTQAATVQQPIDGNMQDVYATSINSPAGRLAEVLLKRMIKGENGIEMPDPMRQRFDRLVSAPGCFGELARVRFAAALSSLFERAPTWTSEKIIPLFDWESPEAVNSWNARKYSNYIGSPKLFELMKKSFLQLFRRPKSTEDDLHVYAQWLTTIMLANQSKDAAYSITAIEARSALRAAGARALFSVSHRLAIEMESAKPEQKATRWQTVVGPVFESIWPLDVELQSPDCTFKLIQILLACGDVFPKAADAIVPFIQPEDPRKHTSLYSISKADESIYAVSPERLLDVVAAAVGDRSDYSVYGLDNVLKRIRAHAPNLVNSRKFQRLAMN